MAIIVKGKIRLCQTSLSDWNPERVNGVLFYERYREFVNLFAAKIPEVNFEQCFAQPIFNDETNTIEWFSLPMDEYPCSLNEVPDPRAEAEKNRIISVISDAVKSLSENDRKYLNPILTTLLSDQIDSETYHYNGQVVFGIWGMSPKKGRVIQDVIIDDIKDHRTHHVKYKIKGKGKLAFAEIVRRHGHVLGGEADIPTFEPAPGYEVQEWLPESPSGVKVDRPLEFTIVFKRDPSMASEETEVTDGIAAEAPTPEPVVEEPKPQEPNFYNVKFASDDRGVVHGTSEYRKKEGEHVLQAEVPHVEPKDGYRFIGWSANPIDFLVNGDTVFTAQYEPIAHRSRWWWLSGCLSWLLALLLLLLIGLLLWFLLGRHNLNFCGCNCDCGCNEVVEEPEDPVAPEEPEDPSNEPIFEETNCDGNAMNDSGGYEEYSRTFDMGQKSGNFYFHYNTQIQPDEIIIHDGPKTSDPVIFYYPMGGTEYWKDTLLHFTQGKVCVEVNGGEYGTVWEFVVDCPIN